MSNIIEARVRQKTDTLANWNANDLVLLGGEPAFVLSQDGQPVNFKLGDGTKTFSELPYWIQYDQAAFIPVSGLALPTPSQPVGYSILGEGTYTHSSGDFTVPSGHWGVANWDGSAWSFSDKGFISAISGTDTIVDELIPKGKAVKKYSASKSQVGIISISQGDNILLELHNSNITDPLLWQDGFWNKTTGVLGSSTSIKASVKKYPIPEGYSFDYSFVLQGNAGVVFYDANDVKVGEISTTNAGATVLTGTYTTPAGTNYMRVSHNAGSSPLNILFNSSADVEIVTSNVFMKSDEANSLIDQKTATVKTDTLDEVTEKLNTFGLKTLPANVNLYSILENSDLDNTAIWTPGFLRNTGVITPDANWRTSDFLPIPVGSFQSNLYCAGSAVILIYDLNKNITQVLANKGASTGTLVWSFTVSGNEAFIRVVKGKGANFNAYIRPTTDLQVNEIITEAKTNSLTISKDLNKTIAKLRTPVRRLRPIIVLQSDDGSAENSWFINALNTHGFKATFGIITGRMGTSGWFSKADVIQLEKDGFEVAGHSKSHNVSSSATYLANITDDERQYEIGDCKFDLEQLSHNIRARHFISPAGSTGPVVSLVLRQYGFETNSITQADSSVSTGAFINRPPLNHYYMKRVSIDEPLTPGGLNVSRLAFLKSAVDRLKADGGLAIFAIHPHYNQYTNPSNTVDSKQEVRDFLAYIASEGIHVLTMSQAMDYYRNTSIGNEGLDSQYYEIGIDGTSKGTLL